MTQRFSITVEYDEHGRPIGAVPGLDDCVATGRDIEEMLDNLEEEVRVYLVSVGYGEDADIELIGHDVWAM